MKLTRRELINLSLKVAAVSQASMILPMFRALAAPLAEQDHFFVLVRTNGGLDCTLGLDPQVHTHTTQENIYLDYDPSQIIRGAGRIRLGPSAASLAKYSGDMCIINGIMMTADLGHQRLLEYMSSGSKTAATPLLPVRLAMGPSGSLLGVTTNSSSSNGFENSGVHNFTYDEIRLLAQTSGNDASTNPIIAQMSRVRRRGDPFNDVLAVVAENKPVFEALREGIRKISGGLGRTSFGVVPSAEHMQAMAVALASGATRFGSLQIDELPDLDTHSGHSDPDQPNDMSKKRHLRGQKEVWDAVAQLIEIFRNTPYRNGSLYERTTFMVVSEFSRTAPLNERKGKDHNPFTNSAVLIGRGIVGGNVVGRSRVAKDVLLPSGVFTKGLHIATPMDFRTGRTEEEEIILNSRLEASVIREQSFIKPEHVARTMARLFGDPPGFDYATMSTPLIPGVVR